MRIGMAFGEGLIPQGSLNDNNLLYAKQLGVTDIILHLPDEKLLPSTQYGYWTVDDLLRVKDFINSYGLNLAAIENFPLDHWYDVLLDGPGKFRQIENIKRTITNMGKAGIMIMGYYFSIAGVWGRTYGQFARGNALSDGFSVEAGMDLNQPIPRGEVWGMSVRPNDSQGYSDCADLNEMWGRLEFFLKEIVPVAVDSQVRMAAHPDDPPASVLRQTARLLTHPDHFDRLLDIMPSYYNALEFCQGTISYMAKGDLYDSIKKYAARNSIAYVHLRNNCGRYPDYYETFIDDGDWDILKCLKLYKEFGFNGVLMPDHTPQVTCNAPFHAGFAHAIGFIKAGLLSI